MLRFSDFICFCPSCTNYVFLCFSDEAPKDRPPPTSGFNKVSSALRSTNGNKRFPAPKMDTAKNKNKKRSDKEEMDCDEDENEEQDKEKEQDGDKSDDNEFNEDEYLKDKAPETSGFAKVSAFTKCSTSNKNKTKKKINDKNPYRIQIKKPKFDKSKLKAFMNGNSKSSKTSKFDEFLKDTDFSKDQTDDNAYFKSPSKTTTTINSGFSFKPPNKANPNKNTNGFSSVSSSFKPPNAKINASSFQTVAKATSNNGFNSASTSFQTANKPPNTNGFSLASSASTIPNENEPEQKSEPKQPEPRPPPTPSPSTSTSQKTMTKSKTPTPPTPSHSQSHNDPWNMFFANIPEEADSQIDGIDDIPSFQTPQPQKNRQQRQPLQPINTNTNINTPLPSKNNTGNINSKTPYTPKPHTQTIAELTPEQIDALTDEEYKKYKESFRKALQPTASIAVSRNLTQPQYRKISGSGYADFLLKTPMKSQKTKNFAKYLDQLSQSTNPEKENDALSFKTPKVPSRSTSSRNVIDLTQNRQNPSSFSASSGFNKSTSYRQPQWQRNRNNHNNYNQGRNNYNQNRSGFKAASIPIDPKLIEATKDPIQQQRARQRNKMAMLDGSTKFWGKLQEHEKGAPPADDAPIAIPRIQTPLQGRHSPNRYNYNNRQRPQPKTQYVNRQRSNRNIPTQPRTQPKSRINHNRNYNHNRNQNHNHNRNRNTMQKQDPNEQVLIFRDIVSLSSF